MRVGSATFFVREKDRSPFGEEKSDLEALPMIKIIPLVTMALLMAACGSETSEIRTDPDHPLVIEIDSKMTFGTAMRETVSRRPVHAGRSASHKIVRWKYDDSELPIPVTRG